MGSNYKYHILFVCLGNICRSPAAEAVFKNLLEKEGLINDIYVDSCGLSAYHRGQNADSRMIKHAEYRNYNLTSKSRPFEEEVDFDLFDMIIGMDDDNINGLKQHARNHKDIEKVYKLNDFSSRFPSLDVPDPYYGGDQGFELVFDMIEDSCNNILCKIKKTVKF